MLPTAADNTSIDIRFVGDSNSASEEARVDDVTVRGDNVIVDVCTNLEGAQSVTPEGYVNNDGICTVIVPPVDMCPNISGDQSEVPSGMQVVEGQCVEIVTPPEDMCPNIDGVQATIPSGKQLVDGNCVDIIVQIDVCTNIDGMQLVTPEGMTNNDGICTVIIVPPVDVCSNLEGTQTTTPEGYTNNEGMCTPIEVPPVDVCTNIEGIQEQTPEGMTNNEGTCTENSTPAPTPEPTPTTGGGLLWGPTFSTVAAAPQGQVLGASTSCGLNFTKSLRRGYKNDTESVKKLQKFLNDYMSAGLTESGVFDTATENALKAFQVKYANTVLTPWGLTAPTGVLHTTTRTQINNMMCPDLKLPVPTQLIPMTRQDL